jgi:hypothetical protein
VCFPVWGLCLVSYGLWLMLYGVLFMSMVYISSFSVNPARLIVCGLCFVIYGLGLWFATCAS